jgi:hypothetical protein
MIGIHRCGLVVMVTTLSACATMGNGVASQSADDLACDSLNLPEPSFLGRYKPEGFQYSYQDYAELTYLYAQMSDNAYPAPPPWVLPDSIQEVRSRDDSTGTGFAARVYALGPNGAPSKVVIAFRGTEGAFLVGRDWRYGNLGHRQQLQAESLYVDVRRTYPATPIVVTGHSLGGALAMQVSLSYDSIPAYVFNTSYKVIRWQRNKKNYRLSIAETGEVLRGVRFILKNINLLHLPGYDCTEGNAIRNHSMTALARCLTRIAAAGEAEVGEGARQSLQRNLIPCRQPAVTTSSPKGLSRGSASSPASRG